MRVEATERSIYKKRQVKKNRSAVKFLGFAITVLTNTRQTFIYILK